MNIIDKAVKSGVFAPVYLLYGEEDYLMQFNKTKLRDALISPGNEMNLSTWKGDSFDLGQFRDQAQTLPFFADHRLLIAEYCGLFKKGGQEMAELLPQLPETSVVLFLEHEVDNRGKLMRYVKENGAILECKHLKEKEMKDWILLKLGREGKQIQYSAMDLLLQRVGDDMETVSHEVDKLISYTGDRDAVMLEDVREVVTVHTESRVYELAVHIAGRDTDSALVQYRDLLSRKETPLGLLAMLSRYFERLMRIRDLRDQGYDTGKITEKLKANPYAVKQWIPQAGLFTPAQLRQIVAETVGAEEDVKSGRMEDVKAVELCICSACRRK